MRAFLRAARRSARRLRRPGNPAIILMYHSISEEPCPWELTVTPAAFAGQLELLARRADVLALDDMVTALDRGTLPERSVAITFDDGYVDNLQAAAPLLERYGFPATVFVTAGLVGTGQTFWWDELARLTLASPQLPRIVELEIGAEPFSFDLAGDARSACDLQSDLEWRFLEPAPTRRHLLLQTLWQQLQVLPEAERERALCDLRQQAPVPSPATPERRIMEADELIELARGGLVEIGAHTVTHPCLSQLPIEDQRSEIAGSKTRLEQLIDRPVSHFAYPHGGPDDYTAATAHAVCAAGFRSACVATDGWLRPGTDRFQLPRVQVPPVSGAAFERMLAYWL